MALDEGLDEGEVQSTGVNLSHPSDGSLPSCQDMAWSAVRKEVRSV